MDQFGKFCRKKVMLFVLPFLVRSKEFVSPLQRWQGVVPGAQSHVLVNLGFTHIWKSNPALRSESASLERLHPKMGFRLHLLDCPIHSRTGGRRCPVSHRHTAKAGHEFSSTSRISFVRRMGFVWAIIALLGTSDWLAAQAPPVPPPTAPVGVTCQGAGQFIQNVALTWTNTEVYDQIILRRDGVVLQTLPGNTSAYLDPDSPATFHVYSVHGMRVGLDGAVEGPGGSCTIQLFPPPLEPPMLPPNPLHMMPLPLPGNLFEFVANMDAAILLGKTLFWDMQAGSDGVQSCATCHYHAGSDHRTTQLLNEGPNGTLDVTGLNGTITSTDFPFHQLSNPDDQHSAVISSKDDILGSMGIMQTDFVSIIEGSSTEIGTAHADPVMTQTNSDGSTAQLRATTKRNAPSVINAIHFVEAFWDGRASFWFNGRDNWGARNTDARVLKVQPDGSVAQEQILLDFAALASQAVGPIESGAEMSAHGRDLFQIGKKLLALEPLAGQQVHVNDSVLGPYRDNVDGMGLSISYEQLVSQAFITDWYASDQLFDGSGQPLIDGNTGLPRTGVPANINEYTMMEANFSLFWGLSIMLYEATLLSDDSPFDRFMRHELDPQDPLGDPEAMTPLQQAGMSVLNVANCMFCHTTSVFSSAVSSKINTVLEPEASAIEGLLERMPMKDFQLSIYDGGFYNIGVTLTNDDLGRGANDPFGHGLSMAKGFQEINALDPTDPNYNNFLPFPPSTILLTPGPQPWEDIGTAGAFKTPTLRNTELTGPYFHNGSYSTLDQVVDFYSRGGNFHDQNFTTLAPEMFPMPFLIGHPDRKSQLVAFLESLTDERVRWERAPFDHPELHIPIGPETAANGDVVLDGAGNPVDRFKTIPAVGFEGRMVETDAAGRALEPLTAFLQPTAVTDLQCNVTSDQVDLSWTPPDDLNIANFIRIYKDGVEIVNMPGSQTAYSDPGVLPGERFYEVFGEDAHLGLGNSCTVYISPPSVTGASFIQNGSQLTIEWTNGWLYDAIDMYRDGALLAENLAGLSQLYVDTTADAGTHTYEIVGKLETSTGGLFIESLPTSLTAERTPLAPSMIGCTTPGGTEVRLDWANAETYSDVVISRNGSAIATVPGDNTSYSDLGSLAGISSYSIHAVAGGLASGEAECGVQRNPLPVADMICDSTNGDGNISWTNAEPWQEAHVLRDGLIIAQLTGNEASHTDTLLPSAGAGTHSYSIRTFVDGLNSDLASCSVQVAPTPVVLFTCIDTDQGVLMTWTNMSNYETLSISREGSPLATLPGASISHLDTTAPSGQVNYAIVATVEGTDSSADTCDIELSPAPITGFACSTVAEGVALSWTNGEVYDEVDVRRGGVLMATVAGTETQWTDTSALGGASQYTLTPRFETVNGSESEICLGYYQPTAVIALQADILDPCSGASNISWLNTSLYDWIRLEVNGIPVLTMPGIMNDVNLTLGVGSIHSIAVIAITDDMESSPAIMTVNVPADDAMAPSDVTSTVDPDSCEASISWTNNGSYSEVRVLIDGVQAATATAQDTTIVVALPGAGTYTVQVDATSSCGLVLPGASTEATCAPRFRRGDHNGDGALDISDPLGVLGYMFSNAPVTCEDASDANDDGAVDVSDAVRMLLHLFGGTGPLPAPHGVCGSDPTADTLGCDQEQGCP